MIKYPWDGLDWQGFSCLTMRKPVTFEYKMFGIVPIEPELARLYSVKEYPYDYNARHNYGATQAYRRQLVQ